MPPYPRILLNAAAPQTDTPAAVLVRTNIETPCPAVPRRGPEAGEHHKQNFSNLSYPHETAIHLFYHPAGGKPECGTPYGLFHFFYPHMRDPVLRKRIVHRENLALQQVIELFGITPVPVRAGCSIPGFPRTGFGIEHFLTSGACPYLFSSRRLTCPAPGSTLRNAGPPGTCRETSHPGIKKTGG